ncbi:MAG TPA: toll/interleukin-1 receptor domain-containing protein [Thermoanaerobaculia bacterium]|nr:toll/interleukin-1 receptor domain-containing protein [Thermoanaerobaculia bacterium]
MDVFISHSAADRKWALKLNQALVASGLTTWLDEEQIVPGTSWRSAIHEAIQVADDIVVLLGPRRTASGFERYEWQAALEAIWLDPAKRLIPVLLKDAELPAFVRSTVGADEPFAAIRIKNPRVDWDRAVSDLLQVLKGEADLRTKGELISTIEEDRSKQRERRSYIRKVAASFPS